VTDKNFKRREKIDDQEEMKETLAGLVSGKLKRVPMAAREREDLQRAAAESLKKANRINIRISPQDLERIKKKASAAGIPYQTLIGAILHQYASDRISASI
jgi:predicted DNA binding CopG/RHH family protein